jgi:transmembrane sensor
MAPETDFSVSEQAAHWWALLHSEGTTESDAREFGDWIARSPERVEAFLQTARLMRALKSRETRWPATPIEDLIHAAKAAAPDPQALPGRSGGPHPGALLFRAPKVRRWIPYAATAVVLMALAAAWLVFTGPREYRTRFGEQRSVLLEDGSRVTLNTASRIAVDLKTNRRFVRLLEGEALFEVAHNAARPFEVEVSHTLLRAVGTQFDVDLRANRTTLTVVEGKVAVVPDGEAARAASALERPKESLGQTPAGSAGGATTPSPLIVAASERLIITAAGSATPEAVANVAAVTAWVQRRLIFDHRPLAEVVQEFNRYNRAPIVLEDPRLQQEEVTGVFQSDDPASFLSFLASISGVEIHEAPDGTRVVRARKSP